MLGLQNEREWGAFCREVLKAPDLTEDPRFETNEKRSMNKDALTARIIDVFSGLTGDQVIARLNAAKIANARMNEMADVWNHAQLAARNRWREVGSQAGPIPALLPPGGIGVEPRMDPVPSLGAHSRAILTELGYQVEEIDLMAKQGAI